MLLHRNNHIFLNFNRSIQSISKTVNNDLAIVNYKKQEQIFDINIIDNESNDENILENIISIEDDEIMKKNMARSFILDWKPLQTPSIYAISFYIDSLNRAVPVYKYGNIFALLPISDSVIYAGTMYMSIVSTGTSITAGPAANYTQGNIFSVTRNNIFDLSFQFNSDTTGVVGQGVNLPNTSNNKIYAIARDASNNIYIGGSFYIDDGTINGIKGFAKWDVTQQKWFSVGNFQPGGVVFNLPSGAYVYSIVVKNQNEIYVGGYFSYIDVNNPTGSAALSFAKWDGFNWNRNLLFLTDGSSPPNPASVYAMKLDGNNLYIGGSIFNAKTSTSTTIRINNILRFNIINNGFSSLIGGLNGVVYAMDVKPGRALYIGGKFSSVYTAGRDPPTASSTVNNLARWNIATEIIGGRTYTKNKWSVIQYSRSPNINTNIPITNKTNGNRGVTNDVYAIAVNPKNRNIIYVGGLFERTKTTISRAGNIISYFNITKNYTTTLWKQVNY